MVDFTSPPSLLYFLNSTWYDAAWVTTDEENMVYPGEYQQWLMDTFGFTEAIYNAFYDSSTSTSFGAFLGSALQEIADNYGCLNGVSNCTGLDLGAIQWGAATVTKAPSDNWDKTYFPEE